MAFVVEQERKNFEWTPILIGLFVIIFVVGAVYYLFLAETPIISSINNGSDLKSADAELKRIAVTANQERVINHPVFRELKQQVPAITVGETGRSDPFQTF